MKDVVQNNLFPSAEMVLSMTKEFGAVHPGRWQQRLLGSGAAEVDVLLHHGSENTQCHVDTHNAPYLQWKHYLSNQQMNKLTKDFIQVVVSCVTLRYTIPVYAMLCYAMLCHFKLFYVMI